MLDEMLSYKSSAGETSSNGGMDDVPNSFGGVSKYNASSRIKITDITSNEKNQAILQRLKDNDETFDTIYIDSGHPLWATGADEDTYCYTIIDGEDIGWLGYYIGQNTILRELNFFPDLIIDEHFYKQLSRNNSISQVRLSRVHFINSNVFSMLGPFFKNNNSLSSLRVSKCMMGADCLRQLALAIAECNTSLNEVVFSMNEIQSGNIVDIITALSMHPQLKRIDLDGMNIGGVSSTALSTLLRCSTTNLQSLDLTNCGIDDEGLETLSQSIRGSKLQELKLMENQSITIRGWKAVSTLLATPDSNLKELASHGNDIGNEGVLVFANALASNSSLETLEISGYGIHIREWVKPFSEILCDKSSINKTYQSNHILRSVRVDGLGITGSLHHNLVFLNSNEDKQQVAVYKILQYHTHFDVQPFFEWEYKVLPIMINWLTKAHKASTCISALVKQKTSHNRHRLPLDFGFTYPEEGKIERIKLSIVYDFIK